MSTIRKLSEGDLDEYVRIVYNAYPGFGLDMEKVRGWMLKILKEDAVSNFYGLYREGKLLGGMRCLDLNMKLLSTKTVGGGVGLVAVDLLHKKEKVCKKLITYFLNHYRKKGTSIALLYPFRPDFYKKMGFGYGTKMNQYRINPKSLPKGDSKKNTRFLGENDKEKLLKCYNRFMDRTSGMIEMSGFDLQRIFDPKNRIVACEKDGKVRGYIIFTFQPTKKDNFLINDLVVKEFIYESREALMELMTFLHTQLDQVNDVIFNTQEEYFHYLFLDPRSSTGNILPPAYHETNIQGVGIMYRVIDVKGIFSVLNKHNFGNQNCKLKISVRDSFLKKNEGSTIVHFEDGIPNIKKGGRWDLEIILDISDFSSLLMGVVNFRNLYMYGLADISDQNYVDTVNKLFMTETKPICRTLF